MLETNVIDILSVSGVCRVILSLYIFISTSISHLSTNRKLSMANMNMMDVELPSIDIDYDYMLELLITGEFKEHVRGEH